MTEPRPVPPAAPAYAGAAVRMIGSLDNCTVLRYAHIRRDPASGGVEQYLDQLNARLLERHAATILQTYLAGAVPLPDQEIVPVGRGRLIWVPIGAREVRGTFPSLPRCRGAGAAIRTAWRFQDGQASSPTGRLWRALGRAWPYFRYPFLVFNQSVHELFGAHRIDLAAFHWLSYDAETVMQRSRARGVPFVVINHFDNRRLSMRTCRRQLAFAAGIGGVSEANVPDGLRARFACLSDAVDTDVLKPLPVIGRPAGVNGAVVLLPARVAAGKGHADAIHAVALLRQRGLGVHLAFAGARGSTHYAAELSSLIDRLELRGRVTWLGQLSLAELRNWYAASQVVILPSSSEGLPRVLLEAQAMERPVVAYDAGGASRAMIPGETGYLAPVGDCLVLSERIAALVQDAPLRERMGRAGREFVARCFNYAKLVAAHEAFYLRAMGRAVA